MDVDALFSHLRGGSSAAVLGAIRATLATGPPEAASSPTAYFAALMTALERGGLAHAAEVFLLLSLVLPHVPNAVIAQKAALVVTAFSTAVATPAVAKNASALKPALMCAGQVLSALSKVEDSWARPEVVRLFSAAVAFSSDERPKVRRVAQASVLQVLTTQRRLSSHGSDESSGSGSPILLLRL